MGESGSRGFGRLRGATSERTVVNCPPERICVIDLAMEGFSATHNHLTMVAGFPCRPAQRVSVRLFRLRRRGVGSAERRVALRRQRQLRAHPTLQRARRRTSALSVLPCPLGRRVWPETPRPTRRWAVLKARVSRLAGGAQTRAGRSCQ